MESCLVSSMSLSNIGKSKKHWTFRAKAASQSVSLAARNARLCFINIASILANSKVTTRSVLYLYSIELEILTALLTR